MTSRLPSFGHAHQKLHDHFLLGPRCREVSGADMIQDPERPFGRGQQGGRGVGGGADGQAGVDLAATGGHDGEIVRGEKAETLQFRQIAATGFHGDDVRVSGELQHLIDGQGDAAQSIVVDYDRNG